MDEEQIRQLIEEALTAKLDTAFDSLLEKLQTVSTLETPEQPEAPEVPETPEDKAYQKRVERLERKLKQYEESEKARVAELAQQKFENALNSAIAREGLQHPQLVQKLLKSELTGAIEKDGKWLTKDGAELSEYINEFFSTPEGQHFLAPQGTSGGTNTPAPQTPNTSGQTMTADEMLASAFGLV